MQNRLDAAAEVQAANEKQLADVQSAIAAELAARPESVNLISFFSLRSPLSLAHLTPIVRFIYYVPPPSSVLFYLVFPGPYGAIGSTRRGASSSRFREEQLDGAASRARSVRRVRPCQGGGEAAGRDACAGSRAAAHR